MRDQIVFDIETKNTFEDVGGYQNLKDLEISVVGFYSYLNDRYLCLEEWEISKLEKYFKNADLLIGFSSKSFDVPVLEKYFNFKISSIPHFDILEEVQKQLGRKIGLGTLAQVNIGMNKLLLNGLEAIDLYKKGRMEELKNYCLQDVRITKELFDLIKKQGFLLVPDRETGEKIKVKIELKLEKSNQVFLF